MEVTRKNFKTTLPLIEKSIEAADFLVIDTEFTGLINGKDVSLFDSPSEYYMRLLNGSSDFLLIQFGLCAFYWNEKENHYMNDAYNFYLFPRVRPGPERMFLCQSSSLDFLASQGFDFNKLIREGISYMTEPTETRLRDSLTERQKQYSNDKEIITVPEENKQHIEDICKRVRNFLDEKKSDEMEIDRVNAFVRRLLFQELGIRFKNEAFVETKVLENKNRVLKISRIKSESDSKCRDDQKKEKEWEEFEDAIGFSKVARMISQSEKLVVGHNMLLDVIHTLNHFFQPLPADYATFKEFAHCMFPWLLDTKYMSSLPPFKDKINSSVLSHLLTTLSEPPFSMPKAESLAGRGYNCTDEKHHEAGYDAYMTGLCFLAMHAHVASMRGETIARVKAADSAILKPFTNKLYLARTAHQDSPYINLMGDDPSPSRDHVFFITFPQEWQRNDINQLFSAYGPIIIQFLDDNSALVALSRREQARDVLRAFAGSRRVSLIPFNKYKQVLGKNQQQDHYWRRPDDADTPAGGGTPDSTTRTRNANATSTTSSSYTVEEKGKSGVSSNSGVLNKNACRKRTSSGVFEVDDAEPVSKKPEPALKPVERGGRRRGADADSPSGADRPRTPRSKTEAVPNGVRKRAEERDDSDSAASKSDNSDVSPEKKVIARFEKSYNATQCVSAFKESDTWD